MSQTPTLGEVLRRALDAHDARLRVSLPGRIERYDATKRRADVKPLVQGVYVDAQGVRRAESLPVVTNVPVVFPGGGGFAVTFPVAVGDTVLLMFADQSLDRWKSRGGEVDPAEIRPHELSNAVAIVGLQDFVSVAAAHATQAAMRMPSGGSLLLGTNDAAKALAVAERVEAELNALRSAVNALVSAFNTHTHVYAPGPGTPVPTATPLPTGSAAGAVGDVSTARIKVDA